MCVSFRNPVFVPYSQITRWDSRWGSFSLSSVHFAPSPPTAAMPSLVSPSDTWLAIICICFYPDKSSLLGSELETVLCPSPASTTKCCPRPLPLQAEEAPRSHLVLTCPFLPSAVYKYKGEFDFARVLMSEGSVFISKYICALSQGSIMAISCINLSKPFRNLFRKAFISPRTDISTHLFLKLSSCAFAHGSTPCASGQGLMGQGQHLSHLWFSFLPLVARPQRTSPLPPVWFWGFDE